jgi:hydroxyacylglutathione hydrolase
MASPLEIVAVPAFSDNYIWIVHDADSGETAVVDPGDAAPALAETERRGWRVTQVWNTHHHWDHSGGNVAMKESTGCTVSGPAGETIPGRDVALAEGSELRIGEHRGTVIEIPGHTLGHVALHFGEDRIAFVGDTMFAMGCGRLFEGSPEQMHRSLNRLAGLPDETRLYCAHEYTLANARFAAHAFPDIKEIAERLRHVERERSFARSTVPTTVGEERATNPFLLAEDVEQFADLRAKKDVFR